MCWYLGCQLVIRSGGFKIFFFLVLESLYTSRKQNIKLNFFDIYTFFIWNAIWQKFLHNESHGKKLIQETIIQCIINMRIWKEHERYSKTQEATVEQVYGKRSGGSKPLYSLRALFGKMLIRVTIIQSNYMYEKWKRRNKRTASIGWTSLRETIYWLQILNSLFFNWYYTSNTIFKTILCYKNMIFYQKQLNM